MREWVRRIVRRKPFWIRVAYRSLLAMPVTLLTLVAVAAVTGEPIPDSTLGVLIGFVFLGTLFGVGLRLFRLMLVPAAIVSFLLALAAAAFGISFGLRHPESFYDFVASLVALVAPASAFVACAVAVRLRSKDRLDNEPTPRQRRVLRIAGAVGAAAVLASAGLTLAQRPIEVNAGEVVEIVTVADRFVPDEFRVREGDRVTFVVKNEDSYAHDFSVDEFGVGPIHIGPLADRRITFEVELDEPAPEGSAEGLRLYCAVNGHEPMVGKFHVEP